MSFAKKIEPARMAASTPRSPESQPPVCVARRAIGRGQCECPVPSPRVFLHRFPLCSTRGTSAKKKRRTSQAADGRTHRYPRPDQPQEIVREKPLPLTSGHVWGTCQKLFWLHSSWYAHYHFLKIQILHWRKLDFMTNAQKPKSPKKISVIPEFHLKDTWV